MGSMPVASSIIVIRPVLVQCRTRSAGRSISSAISRRGRPSLRYHWIVCAVCASSVDAGPRRPSPFAARSLWLSTLSGLGAPVAGSSKP